MDIVQTSHWEPRGRGERGDLNIPNWFPASHSVCFNYSPILDCGLTSSFQFNKPEEWASQSLCWLRLWREISKFGFNPKMKLYCLVSGSLVLSEDWGWWPEDTDPDVLRLQQSVGQQKPSWWYDMISYRGDRISHLNPCWDTNKCIRLGSSWIWC